MSKEHIGDRCGHGDEQREVDQPSEEEPEHVEVLANLSRDETVKGCEGAMVRGCEGASEGARAQTVR